MYLTRKDEVVEALRCLGGWGTLEAIYRQVQALTAKLESYSDATVRRVLQQHCSRIVMLQCGAFCSSIVR